MSSEKSENVVDQQESKEVETPELSYEELKAQIDELQHKFAAKAENNARLYKETKAAKEERDRLLKQSQEQERLVKEQSEKNGEYEKLYKSTHEELGLTKKQLEEVHSKYKNEKVQLTAMRIATELADGDNAELLSEFVTKDLLKLSDELGALDASIIEDVKNNFKTNSKFKALLKGSKAAGGGAQGNMSGSQQSKVELTREEYSKLSPFKQGEFFSKQKGILID